MDFNKFVLINEMVIRLGFFFGIFAVMAIWEISVPRRALTVSRAVRWANNPGPDMHRVHHSVEDDEANSNFGFNLPWWDRLFGTYRDQLRAGHESMNIGIHTYRDPRLVSWLHGMLWLPFIGKINSYAINRRQWSDDNEQ